MESKKILLVEDDPNFGTVLKDYLTLNDYNVTHAKDGIEGLIMFKNMLYHHLFYHYQYHFPNHHLLLDNLISSIIINPAFTWGKKEITY